MGLNHAALDVLLTRLLWPVPRVRLETARAIARLIRGGDRNAGDALLNWISERTYESEAVLGLNIIEAFDLASYFKFAQVRDAVKAPCHLSDWILKANFHRDSGLFPFRYGYAPPEQAPLPDRIRAVFSAFNGVPQMFQSHLRHLEKSSSLPFVDRWRHEWEWLQVDDHRGMGDPTYFLHGDRGGDRTVRFSGSGNLRLGLSSNARLRRIRMGPPPRHSGTAFARRTDPKSGARWRRADLTPGLVQRHYTRGR